MRRAIRSVTEKETLAYEHEARQCGNANVGRIARALRAEQSGVLQYGVVLQKSHHIREGERT